MSELKIEKILNQKVNLPKKQRILCEYILQNINDVYMLTSCQLADYAGIGEATVFRFIKNMGYESYAELRTELHKYSVEYSKSSYWQAKAALGRQDISGNTLMEYVGRSIVTLQNITSANFCNIFYAAVDMMMDSSEVAVLGLRTSKAPALYLQYLLLPVFPNLCQLSHDEHYVFEQIRNLQHGSTLFAISNWPNTKTTVRAAEYCRELNLNIILLTNNSSSEIASYADLVIAVPEEEDHFSIIPHMAVIEAISGEVSLRSRSQSIKNLQELDKILAEQQITNWKKT